MKIIVIVLVILLCALAINFFRAGDDFPLPRVLPAADGKRFNAAYFAGGVALLCLLLWGLRRLRNPSQDDE